MLQIMLNQNRKMNKKIVLVALTALLLGLQSNDSIKAAPAINPLDPSTLKAIDPLDTLDEEDLQAMRDTIKMSRKNLARGTNAVNALDYSVRDFYKPKGYQFYKGIIQNLYYGVSAGYQQILPQAELAPKLNLIQVMGQVGTRLNKLNSLRLSLGAGWGYNYQRGLRLARFSGRFDYMHDITTHFEGYNSSRWLDVQALVGIGGDYTFFNGTGKKKFAPEAHTGAQLKIFTGPHAYLNVEPYIGIGGPQMDYEYLRNWRGFDLFYGVNVGYEFSLNDNLSKAARVKFMLSRLEKFPEETYETNELWRRPWFVEFAGGLNWTETAIKDLSFTSSTGHTTTISIGKWWSPVLGFRFSGFTQIAKREEIKYEGLGNVPVGPYGDMTETFNTHYMGIRAEALFNPFGFFYKSFSWNQPFGGYAFFGIGYGTLSKYKRTFIEKYRVGTESYSFGAHFYGYINPDLQLFIEPRYSHSVYRQNEEIHDMNHMSLNLGLTVMVRSPHYRPVEEMDAVQHYTYKVNKGVRVGVGGGIPMLSRRYSDWGAGDFEWNLQGWFDYTFNTYLGIRGSMNLMNTSRNELLPYNAHYRREDGSMWSTGRNGLVKVNRRNVFGALTAEANLMNLCAGRMNKRKFELHAYVGPAFMWLASQEYSVATSEPAFDGGYNSSPQFDDTDHWYIGVNGGFKLAYPIGKKGVSVFFNPEVYFMAQNEMYDIRGFNTVSITDKLHLYESLNFGVQYKIGKLRRDPKTVKAIHDRHDNRYRSRQLRAVEKYNAKYAKRIAKQHKKR
jgi:hypothetical protein